MGSQNDSRVPSVGADQLPDSSPTERVQTTRDLVQKQQIATACQCARQLEFPLLPARQVLTVKLDLWAEVRPLEQLEVGFGLVVCR